MRSIAFILAETEVDWPKIVFGVIFFLIWALSALVSWINKQQQEAKRRRVRDELARATQRPTPRQAPQPPAAPQRRAPQRIAEGIAQRFPDVLLPPAPPPAPPRQPQRRPVPLPPPLPAPKQVRRQAKAAPPRRVVPVAPPVSMPHLEEISPPDVNITQPRPRAKSPTLGATAVGQWLTPATLRQQYILTEILQPPLAMRPPPTSIPDSPPA